MPTCEHPNPAECPTHGNRAQADNFKAVVTEPLRTARDHCHWLAVHRQHRTAGIMEALLDAALRIAYETEGRLARGEQ